MATKKKPATARKAAKPVMAWAMKLGGHVRLETISPLLWQIEPMVNKWRDSGNDARVVRVRIVEVRR